MKKPSTAALRRRGKLPDGQLTIGLDLGDRSSFYCVLNGAGEVILEERVATNPGAMKKTFEKMPASRIALEDRHAFSMGESTPYRVGTRSDRGTCA
jgi:predicted NBD/HSP70 family sugar kinase